MSRGARPGLKSLYQEFRDRVSFVSVYVREAHPGEIYSRHATDEQKLRHARDWVELDDVRWLVAVDTLHGATHRAYGVLPNAVFLIDRTGHLAFRALWAGQQALLRDRIRQLLRREAGGEAPIVLGKDDKWNSRRRPAAAAERWRNSGVRWGPCATGWGD